MRRKTLIVTVGGTLAAAAIVGTAIGAGAPEWRPRRTPSATTPWRDR
ncbi:hypothetical protein [Plantactinospora sp. CA-290183]